VAHHQRRPDQAITDPDEQMAIIRRCKHLTIAMARGGEPYLATVNYGYDEAARAFFFHSSTVGKKIEILRENPLVWGQIMEDLGYCDGRCQHAFRTLQFCGRVLLVEDPAEKRRALSLMIEHLERDPSAVKARFVDDRSVRGVAIGRIDVQLFSAKRGKTDD